MICPKCGKKLDLNAAVCPVCKTKIQGQPQTGAAGNASVGQIDYHRQGNFSNHPQPNVYQAPSSNIDYHRQGNFAANAYGTAQSPTGQNVNVNTGMSAATQEPSQVFVPNPMPAPQTVPPVQNNTVNMGGAPSFTPPPAPAPNFTPPQQNSAANMGGAPIFTPPPTPSFNGPACHWHRDEPAVARCCKCGKPICQDCYEAYGVSIGPYAGQAICYDCTQQIVAENVHNVKVQKGKITVLFVATLIGMGLGATMFANSALLGFICMFWFGSFWAWVKNTVHYWWHDKEGPSLSGLVFYGGICLMVAPIITIKKIFNCIVFLKRSSNIIQSDSEGLRLMAEYMEYTLLRNNNRGMDIETLIKQNEQLANNSVAQMARTCSEEQIEANMRGCLATINENGEIIRSFVA